MFRGDRPPLREPVVQLSAAADRLGRRRRGLGLGRADAARLGPRLGPPQGAALRRLRPHGFRHPGRAQRRLLRQLSGAHRGDAPIPAHHASMHRRDADRPGQDHRRQDLAAAPGRDEALDGGLDPPLQALHRGLPRAGRRDLYRGRGAQGRVRGLSRLGRHQQAVPMQDSRPELRLPAGDRVHVQGPHVGDMVAIVGSMDIVFGEIDR